MAVLFSRFISFNKFAVSVLLCLFALSFFAWEAEAASLSIRPASGSYEIGEEFSVTLELDPEGEPISAVDAIIEFNPSLLYVTGVSGEESVIDDWESEPAFSNDKGEIELIGASTKSIRVNSTILNIDFRVVGYGEPQLSFREATAATLEGETIEIGSDSQSASYAVVEQKPYVYTTVSTVSSDELWPGIFSEAVMLNLGLLIVLLVFLGHLAYVHRQYSRRESRLKKETLEIQEQMTKIFSALRDEIYDQVRSITKRSKLSRKETEAVAGLNQALTVSETLIEKEINDVKSLLD